MPSGMPMMLRRFVLTLLLLLLGGCAPPTDPLEFTLKLNLAGDGDLLAELGLLQIDVVYPDGTVTTSMWDWFDADTALAIEDVAPAEGVIFVVQGFAGPGDPVATGQSEPVDLYQESEAWVLFHRRGVFLQLEGDGLDRIGHRVVPIEGGALVIGGMTSSGDYAPISRLVRTETAGYALEDLTEPLEVVGMTATLMEAGPYAGQVLIAGGGNELVEGFADREISDAYRVFDPAEGAYSIEDGVLDAPRIMGEALALSSSNDGRVLLVGGIEEATSGNILFAANVGVVDPQDGVVDSRSLNDIPWLHSAVLWGPDVAITCGGWDIVSSSLEVQNVCTEYFASDNSSHSYDDVMVQPRVAHGTVLVGDDGEEILLVGGSGTASVNTVPSINWTSDALDTAEVIDPGDGYSTRTVSMNRPRILPFVARLEDEGRILVCGGHDGTTFLADCESYDWSSGSFSVDGALQLPVAADWIQGAVLDDGSVLLVGGHAGGMGPADLGVIYLP